MESDGWPLLAAFAISEVCGQDTQVEMAIHLVDPETMADLNRRHLEKEGPTDVLAFPVDEPGTVSDGSTLLLGDVVVCPKVAADQSQYHGRSISEELVLLVVHGILHLLGHDHAEPEERVVMQRREHELLDWYQSR